MAQGVAWIGGTGNFNDPSNWSSDPDGNPAGSPATPPGADMDAEYLAAGTVSFAGQSNGEADINNAGMVFDLSGGGYTLSGIGGNQALQFDVGEVESDSPTLTVTGANTLDTEGLNAADAATITVTGGATLDVLGAPTTFLFNQAVVKDGGTFAFDSGLNFTQYSGETANLSVDGGTVAVGEANGKNNTGATFAGGTTVTVQDKGAINVIGPASFGTGVATFSGGSKLTASSLTVDADSQTSKHASLTLTGSGSNANIAGFAIVGDYGAASLGIDAGAAFQAQSLYVGVNSNSGGTVDLTGAGSSLVVSQTLVVGYLGAGALLASGGASVTVDGSMTIGQSAGSNGQVTISGTGDSLIVKGNLIVGANGSATLDVSKDATFDVTGETIIGDSGGTDSSADLTSSPAAVSQTGSVALNVGNDTLHGPCIIGDNAKGTLTIDSNSILNANNYNLTIGSQKTGNGTLTVDGGGAALSNIKNLIVGAHGAGSVEINSLGAVDAYDLDDGSTSSSSQGTGTITVSFGNLDVADEATIGMYASGSLTVKNKGLVKIGNRLSVDPFGTVTVSSNSGIGVDASAGSNGFVTIGKHGVVFVAGDYSANTMIAGGALFVISAIAGGYGISFKGAGSVTLGSQVTLSESNKISGFGTGDSITLEGITATDKSYNPSNGALTLEDTGSDVATLYFSGSYTRSNFRLKEVGGSAVVSFNPSKGSAASVQEQIFNSALLSDSLGYHGLDALGGRGSTGASATPGLWSVGHAPGG